MVHEHYMIEQTDYRNISQSEMYYGIAVATGVLGCVLGYKKKNIYIIGVLNVVVFVFLSNIIIE